MITEEFSLSELEAELWELLRTVIVSEKSEVRNQAWDRIVELTKRDVAACIVAGWKRVRNDLPQADQVNDAMWEVYGRISEKRVSREEVSSWCKREGEGYKPLFLGEVRNFAVNVGSEEGRAQTVLEMMEREVEEVSPDGEEGGVLEPALCWTVFSSRPEPGDELDPRVQFVKEFVEDLRGLEREVVEYFLDRPGKQFDRAATAEFLGVTVEDVRKAVKRVRYKAERELR